MRRRKSVSRRCYVMADEAPDNSLGSIECKRGGEKPALLLVRHFQVKEADYMKPPLAEQLLEPDGAVAPTPSSAVGVTTSAACTCNTVCTCVPVTTCACNTVCTCNTVNTSHGVESGGGGCYGGGGGTGGYWAPCF